MVRKVGLTDSVGFACLEDLQLSNSYMWGTAISLDYCGREDCIKGWKFGPYVRESYVIHMVKKGKGTFTIAGKTYELGPGQAFIIRPGEETTYRADDDDPWSYMWVGFHGYRAEDFIEAMGYVKGSPIIKIEQMDTCAGCINKMLEYSQITRINEVKRMSALMLLFATIMEDNASDAQESDNIEYPSKIYVKAAVDFITEKYMNKIKIDDIADFIGISRSHLFRSFQTYMNCSPKEYLTEYRIQQACRLLKETGLSVSAIAYSVGFENNLYFSKAFRKVKKTSPTEYREKHRKKKE